MQGREDPGHLLLTMRGQPLIQRTSYWIVRRAADQAGRRAHPHAFRRAIATALMRSGVPVTAVQQLLGHQSIETNARYLGVDREDLHRTVELLEHGRDGTTGPKRRPRYNEGDCDGRDRRESADQDRRPGQ